MRVGVRMRVKDEGVAEGRVWARVKEREHTN